MEQKRILWIIAAVGVFFLVVIGAALILYSPTQATDPAIASLQIQNDTWTRPSAASGTSSLEPVQNVPDVAVTDISASGSEVLPGTAGTSSGAGAPTVDNLPAAVDGMTVISGNTTVYGTGMTTTIDLNTLKYSAPVQSSSVTAMNQVAADAVSSAAAAKPSAPGVPSDPPKPDPAAVPKKEKAEAVPAPVAKTTTATASASTAAEAKTTVSTTLPDVFWVQAASFTSKRNAEDAREALTANKIESEIFTYTGSDNKTYYRLRAGPYVTKTEAEFWRSRIMLIDEFADTQSYVTNSSAKKQ